MEYQIVDRSSFRQFLGIENVEEVPDEKTVWYYRNRLSKAGTFDCLFTKFRTFLDSKGLCFNEGKIIDATFVEAPKQRNSKEENKLIKEGKGDSLWNNKPHKKRHKDIDARWTKKRGESHYGYKNHIKVDNKTKLIDTYETTSASVHDSNVIEPLIEERDKGQDVYLDSGYESKEEVLLKHNMSPHINEKGHRNHPLTQEQKERNRIRSKVRSRVEHVFGFIEGAMHGSVVRSIGMVRAKAMNALTNLVYNIFRYIQINIYQPQLINSKG